MEEVKRWFRRTIAVLVPTVILSFVNFIAIIIAWGEFIITDTIQATLVPIVVLGTINFVFGLALIGAIGMTLFKFFKLKN